MENIDVISIYRYDRKENIDMISILIFANIAIPTVLQKVVQYHADGAFFLTHYSTAHMNEKLRNW